MSNHESQVSPIYKEAIRRYEEITRRKLDDPSILKMRSVDDLLRVIDQRNEQFSEFRETRQTIFHALEIALKPVELVNSLAQGGASMAFPPSSLVFGAASYLVNAAKGVSVSYDAIEDLMVTLKVRCCHPKSVKAGAVVKAIKGEYELTAQVGSHGAAQHTQQGEDLE